MVPICLCGQSCIILKISDNSYTPYPNSVTQLRHLSHKFFYKKKGSKERPLLPELYKSISSKHSSAYLTSFYLDYKDMQTVNKSINDFLFEVT